MIIVRNGKEYEIKLVLEQECDECKTETEVISQYEGKKICPHCLIDNLL